MPYVSLGATGGLPPVATAREVLKAWDQASGCQYPTLQQALDYTKKRKRTDPKQLRCVGHRDPMVALSKKQRDQLNATQKRIRDALTKLVGERGIVSRDAERQVIASELKRADGAWVVRPYARLKGYDSPATSTSTTAAAEPAAARDVPSGPPPPPLPPETTTGPSWVVLGIVGAVVVAGAATLVVVSRRKR